MVQCIQCVPRKSEILEGDTEFSPQHSKKNNNPIVSNMGHTYTQATKGPVTDAIEGHQIVQTVFCFGIISTISDAQLPSLSFKEW